MRHSMIVIFQTCLLFLIHYSVFAQKNVNPQRAPSKNNLTTIVTKVPFNGVYYYLKISPIDVHDHIPVYNPQTENEIVWNDSLQRLLPDSILKQLPEQKNKHQKYLK